MSPSSRDTSHPLPDDVVKHLHSYGLYAEEDGKVLWCDGASSHPKNWPLWRKTVDTAIITVFGVVSAMIGNVGSAVAHEAVHDFGLSPPVGNIVFVSTFFFGQGMGGLLLPPYTESFGRKITNVVGSFTIAVACVIVGVPQSLPAAVVGRWLSGFLSAIPTVIGSGIMEDMWDVQARVWAIDIWIKGTIVGIALGPTFGTYVSTSSLRWPWVFYISAMLMGGASMALVFTKESRPSVIMSRQIKAIEKSTKCGDGTLWTDNQDKVPNLQTFSRTMLIRPIHWFCTEPIIFTVTIMSGTIFAAVYLQTEGLIVTYQEFGFSRRHASLVFIAWIIGLTLTIPLRMNDWRIVARKIRQKKQIRPEDKLVGFYVAAPVLAVALWWFSWTVPPVAANISPFVSLTALLFVGACTNEFDGILQGYLTDAYSSYAASANAPLAFLRGILSAAFPIFGTQMFSGLGPNVAGSILASIATSFCFIAFWFWKRGAATRQKSKYAVDDEEEEGGETRSVHDEETNEK